MNNPLNRRLPRELKSDFGKYLVIFLFLLLSISEVSGFLVADGSLTAAYKESFEKYNVEDGHFMVRKKADSDQLSMIEDTGVSVFPLFFSDRTLDQGSTLRIFKMRDTVNLASLLSGRFPENEGEIAVDRVFAANNGFNVGDTVASEGKEWVITGFVALSDYSTMYESNSDSMFDATLFGVSVVAESEFEQIPENSLKYCYAFKYADENAAPVYDTAEEIQRSDEFLEKLKRIAALTDYVPRYQNQAIKFAGDDMGDDEVLMNVMLYIITVIIAFVFAVTISNKISEEAPVIGTLLASGYTKNELIRHYMILPFFVSVMAAIFGNVIGYTVLRKWNENLYYASYSLTAARTRWDADAFLKTTIIPIILLLVIDYVVLRRKLKLSPISFMRGELRKKGRAKPVQLPSAIPFLGRFRIRIILQNLPNYLLIAVGVLFANILLMFGLLFPALLNNYEKNIPEMMFADYQYILQYPAEVTYDDNKINAMRELLLFLGGVSTKNEDAEKFSAWSLKTISEGSGISEDVLIYGVNEDSRYISDGIAQGEVLISTAYAEKYRIGAGDVIRLKEAYREEEYEFAVTGTMKYDAALCIFMNRDDLNEMFGLPGGMFAGYFSDSPITDISEKYISQVIDIDAVTKVSRQLMNSLGSTMSLVDVFAVIMFVILIYLLSKVIIEKNAQSISMAKILGYTDREIGSLYVTATTIVVTASLLLMLPAGTAVIKALFRFYIMMNMKGWLPFNVDYGVYVKMILLGIGTYAVVAVFEMRKIRKVPMDEALKNAE